VNRIVDRVAIAPEKRGGRWDHCGITEREKKMGEGVWNVPRTWVGGEADNLGASKAITVVTLRANEEGRGVCRGVPPSLKTSEVYVLFVSFKKRDSRVLARVCVRGLREGASLGLRTLTVPLHRQGRMRRPRSGSGPSRHILH